MRNVKARERRQVFQRQSDGAEMYALDGIGPISRAIEGDGNSESIAPDGRIRRIKNVQKLWKMYTKMWDGRACVWVWECGSNEAHHYMRTKHEVEYVSIERNMITD